MLSKLRILILASEYVHHNKPRDGNFIKDQALALNRHGIRTDVVFCEPRSLRSLSLDALKENHFQTTFTNEDGIYTLRQKGWNPWMNSLPGGVVWASLTAILVGDYIKKYGPPDLIHAHMTFWAGYAAFLAKKKYGVPYLLTEHSSRYTLRPLRKNMEPFAKKVLSNATRIISVSKSLAQTMKPYISEKEVTVIPNVVDTDFFYLPKDEPSRKPFIFLAVGNMLPNKGFHILIRSFAASFRHIPDVNLVFGGEGPYQAELENICKKLGVDHKVRFLGALSREKVRETMWEAHALVLPSFRETFGVVLIEALSTGLPVIASRSGGPEDIVNPEVGYLFEPGNEHELSICLESMWNRTDFSRTVCRNYALSHFSEKAVAEKLYNVYNHILNDDKSGE